MSGNKERNVKEMPTTARRTVALAFVVVSVLATPARAQSFEELLGKAAGHYRKEEYAQAKKRLEQAMATLDAKRAAQWTAFFPAAPDGWQATPVKIKTQLFGGESIERTYSKGNSSIVVQVDQGGMGALPLEMARGALISPEIPQARKDAMVAENGLRNVGGFLRMVKEKAGKPSINVRICRDTAIEFTGDTATMAEVEALANATDCNRLFFWVVKGERISGPIGKPAKAGNDIVGKWAAEIDGQKLVLEFRRDLSMTWIMTLPKQTQPATLPARYLVNYKESPIQLEILDLPLLQQPLLGILTFKPDGSMVLEVDAGTDDRAAARPVSLAGATTFRRVD
jgi:hypothetical protein